MKDSKAVRRSARRCAVALATLFLCITSGAQAESFKVAVLTALSGPGADSFGVPQANAAKLLVQALNEGKVPAPYGTKGIGGMPIEMTFVDEIGAAKVLDVYRSVVQRDKVDVVLGPMTSGPCLAVAPVAEQLKALTILSDCGTTRIFEEADYRYVFRAGGHSAMDNVALARYLVDEKIPMKTISSLQPDYAYGREALADFKESLRHLAPEKIEYKTELWPKFGAGQYGAEISALLRDRADVVHSSIWGGDFQAFVQQAEPRGLFKRSQFAFLAVAHVFPRMPGKVPDGLITGERGAVGPFARPTPLNDWFVTAYREAYKEDPAASSAYRIVQSILALKTAAEKAMKATGGKKPTTEQIADAMVGLEWETPSGTIRMALGKGHQAIQDSAIGMTKWDPEKKAVVMTRVRYYAAECINPPEGVKAEDWIKSGFKGAKCN